MYLDEDSDALRNADETYRKLKEDDQKMNVGDYGIR